MIEIQNVCFGYGKYANVFNGISMQLKAGNIYGLLGENGVGKTTFLRLVSGLLFPKEGSIRVNGFEPKKRKADFLKDIFYVPETFVAPKLSCNEYASTRGVFYPHYNAEQFHTYLHEFGVEANKKIAECSHGQQKKIMIAFALACNTPLLLMDEPTNGLDIPSKASFRKLIAQIATEDKCIVISTHQVRDLENLIDPIVILEYNQILLNNSLEEITKKLKFGIHETKNDLCLYSEPALGGYYMVEMNHDGTESKVNIEMLFNAAIQNKDLFKKLFLNK
ncbi:MAG: ABC transporter ATP-binding protein [Bacteroidales bacterium]